MLVCVFFCTICTRDRGCSAHPAFPAPSDWRGREINENLAQNHAARSRWCASSSLRAQQSNPPIRLLRHGLLRFAQNDDRFGCLQIKTDRRPGQAIGASADPGPITTDDRVCERGGHSESINRHRWLWVPAFAGTAGCYPARAFLRYARCTAQLQPGGCEATSLAGAAVAGARVGIASFSERSCADRSCAGM
jgi:hypothetical protein